MLCDRCCHRLAVVLLVFELVLAMGSVDEERVILRARVTDLPGNPQNRHNTWTSWHLSMRQCRRGC